MKKISLKSTSEAGVLWEANALPSERLQGIPGSDEEGVGEAQEQIKAISFFVQ